MGSHKIQIFSRVDIAIASKLQYFGDLFGYKRNLPQNNKILQFFVILRTKSRKFCDIYNNPMDTDTDPFGQKSTDPDPDPHNPDEKSNVLFVI